MLAIGTPKWMESSICISRRSIASHRNKMRCECVIVIQYGLPLTKEYFRSSYRKEAKLNFKDLHRKKLHITTFNLVTMISDVTNSSSYMDWSELNHKHLFNARKYNYMGDFRLNLIYTTKHSPHVTKQLHIFQSMESIIKTTTIEGVE